jgi:hypothetical protein
VGRGLARVEPGSSNTLIAFASKAGSTASDGDSRNSPFTAALVKYLGKPGLDLRKAFGFVRDDVLRNTSNRQEPYVYGSLGGDDVPLVPAKPAVIVAAPDPNAEVRRDYELALQIGTRDVWTAFLAQYPEGLYATLAKGQLNKIAADRAVPDKAAVETTALEVAKPNLEVVSLPPTDDSAPQTALSAAEIVRSMQAELRRVGSSRQRRMANGLHRLAAHWSCSTGTQERNSTRRLRALMPSMPSRPDRHESVR